MHFSEKSLDFLFENRLMNSKEWYDANKPVYQEFVVAPLADFVRRLEPVMSEIDSDIICDPRIGKSISRVRRDTRFSKDKTLYRDVAWAVFMRNKKLYNGLPGFFFEFSPGGFRYGCGYYSADSRSLDAVRQLIINDDESFKRAQAAYENQTVFTFEGEMYKRNHYPDQPPEKQNWLNRKNIDFICNSNDFNMLFSEDLAEKIADDFKLLSDIYKFLMKAEFNKKHPI